MSPYPLSRPESSAVPHSVWPAWPTPRRRLHPSPDRSGAPDQAKPAAEAHPGAVTGTIRVARSVDSGRWHHSHNGSAKPREIGNLRLAPRCPRAQLHPLISAGQRPSPSTPGRASFFGVPPIGGHAIPPFNRRSPDRRGPRNARQLFQRRRDRQKTEKHTDTGDSMTTDPPIRPLHRSSRCLRRNPRRRRPRTGWHGQRRHLLISADAAAGHRRDPEHRGAAAGRGAPRPPLASGWGQLRHRHAGRRIAERRHGDVPPFYACHIVAAWTSRCRLRRRITTSGFPPS